MDKMLEDFEAVYGKEFHNLPFDSADEETLFKSGCWWAWQASRQALVVELPTWDDYDTPKAIMITVKDILDEMGIKWTE